MGCLHCGRRQVDPDPATGGDSTWRRAVARDEQVLVCPECRRDHGDTGLDSCATCGSTSLVKRLGVITCRACGHEGEPVAAAEPAVRRSSAREALATDVAAALDRLLRGKGPEDRVGAEGPEPPAI